MKIEPVYKISSRWSSTTSQKNQKRDHPVGGIYNKEEDAIVEWLLKEYKTPKEALKRLTFYMNRGGTKIDPKQKEVLEKVKRRLMEMKQE